MSTSRRSSINTDEEAYHPLAIRYTKKDGSPAQCNVFCGLTSADFISILGCYIAFYGFLFGFTALLLKGAIATDETNSFLWAFLVVGIVFSIGVILAVVVAPKIEQRRSSQKSSKSSTDEENQ